MVKIRHRYSIGLLGFLFSVASGSPGLDPASCISSCWQGLASLFPGQSKQKMGESIIVSSDQKVKMLSAEEAYFDLQEWSEDVYRDIILAYSTQLPKLSLFKDRLCLAWLLVDESGNLSSVLSEPNIFEDIFEFTEDQNRQPIARLKYGLGRSLGKYVAAQAHLLEIQYLSRVLRGFGASYTFKPNHLTEQIILDLFWAQSNPEDTQLQTHIQRYFCSSSRNDLSLPLELEGKEYILKVEKDSDRKISISIGLALGVHDIRENWSAYHREWRRDNPGSGYEFEKASADNPNLVRFWRYYRVGTLELSWVRFLPVQFRRR